MLQADECFDWDKQIYKLKKIKDNVAKVVCKAKQSVAMKK